MDIGLLYESKIRYIKIATIKKSNVDISTKNQHKECKTLTSQGIKNNMNDPNEYLAI